jgi:hypothetical protein
MMTTQQERILNALRSGVRTWLEIQQETKLSDERLGNVLNDLFDLRKIWTGERNGTRIYGIERRTDLVPRFPPPLRRSTDYLERM